MPDARAEVGRFGEDVAARYLSDRGLTIIERNWRSGTPRGALDIIARAPDGDLVIVEVKARRTLGVGAPVNGVTPQKLRQLRRLANTWLREHPEIPAPGVRFDVVGVLIGRGSSPSVVQHIPGVVV